MALYEMPAESPYKRPFRISGGVAILLLLGISFVALYEPAGLNDVTRRKLAWVAGAIVLAAVVLGTVLSTKEGIWKLKRGCQVELSDGKIIQRHAGSPSFEIPLNQIESLHEGHGWLIIRGGEPPRQMAVPSNINGLEELKSELTACRTVVPLKVRLSPLFFLPFVLATLAYSFLFISHKGVIVMLAGGLALLLQGWAIYSLRRLMRSKPGANLFTLTCVLTFLVLAWIVYERATAIM
jgi:hypothetical protein